MYNSPYTAEHKSFIAENCTNMTADELVIIFNKTFCENRTKKGLQYFMQTNNLHCIPKVNTSKTVFTSEQEQFLIENAPLFTRAELTQALNFHFHTEIKLNTVRRWCSSHKLASPCGNGRFTSETSPRWQKGLSNEEFKSHYSEKSFKQMISPMRESNIKYHIGDELTRHGIPYVVINDDFGKGIDARIEKKDRYVWKQYGRAIPDDHMIIHLDGDRMNCDISNLRCIPKKYRPFLAKNDWWNASPELKDTAIKWCELFYALKEEDI